MTTYFVTIDSVRRHHPEVGGTLKDARLRTHMHNTTTTTCPRSNHNRSAHTINNNQVFQSKLGQFAASAGAATFGFWVVWPLEVLKARYLQMCCYFCLSVGIMSDGSWVEATYIIRTQPPDP